jgi:hypothetical protein
MEELVVVVVREGAFIEGSTMIRLGARSPVNARVLSRPMMSRVFGPIRLFSSDDAKTFSTPFDMVSEHMQSMRMTESFPPFPYDSKLPHIPINDPPGKLGHKKVSIVGCGQVGMGIAFAFSIKLRRVPLPWLI